jgi:hypothetical protein
MALAAGKGKEIKAVLDNVIAWKNRQHHKTTREIPLELYRGRLIQSTIAPISAEQQQQIVLQQEQHAAKNIELATVLNSNRWINNKHVWIYREHDLVWVRNPKHKQKKGGGRVWEHTATILNVHEGGHSYQLLWGKDGGFKKSDLPHEPSVDWWLAANLKPRFSHSEVFAVPNNEGTYPLSEKVV